MTGPGLAKARANMPVVIARTALLLRAPDPRWRQLFEHADTVSEGGVRNEAHGRVWYGSTSLILSTPEEDPSLLAAVAARDVHVRVRAIRAARREACLRAPSRLGRIVCETRVTVDSAGVRIDVDVQAPLIEGRTARKAGQ